MPLNFIKFYDSMIGSSVSQTEKILRSVETFINNYSLKMKIVKSCCLLNSKDCLRTNQSLKLKKKTLKHGRQPYFTILRILKDVHIILLVINLAPKDQEDQEIYGLQWFRNLKILQPLKESLTMKL